MRISLISRFVAAWAFVERSIVTGKTNTGTDTAVKLQGLNFCKCLSLGLKGMFRLEFHDFGPCLQDHPKVFAAQPTVNKECKCTTDHKFVVCKVASCHAEISAPIQCTEGKFTLLEILPVHELIKVWLALDPTLILGSTIALRFTIIFICIRNFH